ncbi:MAG: hypothetical protein ACI8Y4_005103, partial [Candidatus Poriferisodalaceae bacterium]
ANHPKSADENLLSNPAVAVDAEVVQKDLDSSV